MELNKENMKKIMFLIVFTILVLAGFLNLGTVWKWIALFFHMIFPFILGGAIAFIINMPTRWIERVVFDRWKKEENKKGKKSQIMKKIARPVSMILALLLILLVIAVVILVVVPQLGETVMKLSADIRSFMPKVQSAAIKLFEDNPQIVEEISSVEFEWDSLMEKAVNLVKTGAGTLLGSTFHVASSIVNGTTNFFIGLVFAFYVVLQKEKLTTQVRKILYALLPEKLVEHMLQIFQLTNRTFSSFLTGQCLEAVILGTMFFVVMSILRFPYALLVGILIAFTALIPIFGAFIGCAVGTFLILMENPMQALAFIALFLILQQIEGNLIYPHVVGSSVGLPSMWVLVAVTLGASLMGIVGMLIFIPLVSVVYTIFRGYVYKCLKEKKLLEKAERSCKHEKVQ